MARHRAASETNFPCLYVVPSCRRCAARGAGKRGGRRKVKYMKDLFNKLGSQLNSQFGNEVRDKIGGMLGGLGQNPTAQSLKDGLSGMAGSAAGSVRNAANSAGGLGALLGSAAFGGLLGTLMSGKTARKVAKGALVVGGTAAVGALAWKMFQKWSGASSQAEPARATVMQPELAPQTPQAALPMQDDAARLLLEAMIFAARADGHIDEDEKAHIREAAAQLFPNQSADALVARSLEQPLDPGVLAARVRNHEEALDVYRISAMITGGDHFMERSYLDALATSLGINAGEKAALDAQVVEFRQQQAAL